MTGTEQQESPPSPPWLRTVVAVGAVLAILLLGASAGLVIGGRFDERAPAAPTADSVDVGFSQDMTVHHQQAVLMAGIARDNSTSPRIRSLAYDMETSQLNQIGRMQGFLSLWDQSLLPNGAHMRWMTGPAGAAHHGVGTDAGRAVMPGMASSDEIQQLRDAEGPALDVLFLQLMIRHHQGGMDMLSYAGLFAQTPQVKVFADQMRRSQEAENVLMTQLLTGYGAQPLPDPS